MSNETHESIMTEIQTYSEENGKFVEKGVKASATRARKALAELSKLIKARRKEIQEVNGRNQKKKRRNVYLKGIFLQEEHSYTYWDSVRIAY